MTVYADIEPCHYLISTKSGKHHRVTLDDFLDRYGVSQPPSEREQALHQCPPMVRAAMVAHMRWYFLARSRSAMVRTFALSVMTTMAFRMGHTLKVHHESDGSRGKVKCVRGYDKKGPHRMLPYRVLSVFYGNLCKMGAAGADAELIKPGDTPLHMRCNPRLDAGSRDYDIEDMPGAVIHAALDRYTECLDDGGLVRSTQGRMEAFADAVEPAFQPFLGLEFASRLPDFYRDDYGKTLGCPGIVVRKPRSVTTKAMIPRSLAFAMEQVAEEMPSALSWVQRRSGLGTTVRRLALDYAAQREDAAMQAMAARDNVSDWLHHYDTVAALNWATPTAAQKVARLCDKRWQEPQFNHNPTLDFPGLNTVRW